MPMKYKTQCICKHPDWNSNDIGHEYHDLYTAKDHDENKDVEHKLSYAVDDPEIEGEFSSVVIWNGDDPTDIDDYDEDIIVRFTCSCGDEIFFSEGGTEICACGRVYRLIISLEKNDAHKDDMEYWDKIKASKYERFGKEDENK